MKIDGLSFFKRIEKCNNKQNVALHTKAAIALTVSVTHTLRIVSRGSIDEARGFQEGKKNFFSPVSSRVSDNEKRCEKYKVFFFASIIVTFETFLCDDCVFKVGKKENGACTNQKKKVF